MSSDTKPRTADPQREKRFRCGYREGYVDALNQLRDLLQKGEMPLDEAHTKLIAHWDGPLLEWFKADRNLRLDPPPPRTG